MSSSSELYSEQPDLTSRDHPTGTSLNRISVTHGLKPTGSLDSTGGPVARYAEDGDTVTRGSGGIMPGPDQVTSLPLSAGPGQDSHSIIFVVPVLQEDRWAYQTLITLQAKMSYKPDTASHSWNARTLAANMYFTKFLQTREIDPRHDLAGTAASFGEVLAADLGQLTWGKSGYNILQTETITPDDRNLLLTSRYNFTDPQSVYGVCHKRNIDLSVPRVIRVRDAFGDKALASKHYVAVSTGRDGNGRLRARAFTALPRNPEYLNSISPDQIAFIDDVQSAADDATNAFESFQISVPSHLQGYADARGCVGDTWETEAGDVLKEFVTANISSALKTLSEEGYDHNIVVGILRNSDLEDTLANRWFKPTVLRDCEEIDAWTAWRSVLGSHIGGVVRAEGEKKRDLPPAYAQEPPPPSYS